MYSTRTKKSVAFNLNIWFY